MRLKTTIHINKRDAGILFKAACDIGGITDSVIDLLESYDVDFDFISEINMASIRLRRALEECASGVLH